MWLFVLGLHCFGGLRAWGVLLAFTLILLVVYGVAGLCLTVGFVGWVWYVWLVNSVVVF